jgi:hypothetical protein
MGYEMKAKVVGGPPALPAKKRERKFDDVAAVFVYQDGHYSQYKGLDLWGIERDAMKYDRDLPVVAHPPCARWCQLAALVQKTHGYKIGDDGGMFESALATVRRVGGVLEHPAYSIAWRHFDLPRPPIQGGWVQGKCGGWACHVEQLQYGHEARKQTWLYAFGTDLPMLRWGRDPKLKPVKIVGPGPFDPTKPNKGRVPGFARLCGKVASATPNEFAELLLSIARTAGRVTK